ncbi:SDR family oxidoreductase [Streptomyces sp. NPDC005336]|uniref:SDR family oxidoreductase n=1 Tax=Streptomyces sp. NPDC005336 TaxID=3157035 RepID=UPI0033AE64E7
MTDGIAGATERRIRTGQVELCVAELGDPARPTVMLVHGYPDSKEVWAKVATRLAGHGGFHVVLYDVRGSGRSTAPSPLRGGFTLEKLTDDFLAVADAVSPDRPVHLVGHDWGSVQSWEFVTVGRTQGRIASFTSLSGPSLDHYGHWLRKRLTRPTPRRVAQVLGQSARSWYVGALHTPKVPEALWRGPLGRYWPRILERAERVSSEGYPTASLPNDAAHGAWLYRDNVRERFRRPRADPYAHAPVQLIVPTKDPFISQRLYDDLETWVPELTRRTLAARHGMPLSRPDQLTAWIGEFITSVEEGAPRPGADSSGPYAQRFGGRLVLVTGAAGTIGRAICLAFAAAGARVVAVDQDAAGAARTASLARAAGAPQAWAEAADVSDEQAVEKLALKVAEEYGVVDVLVNDAEAGLTGGFLDTSADQWRRVLDINLWGVIHSCRTFGRQMAERGQGGHIVNTASAAAFHPSKVPAAYGASKAAVLALSESLRAELAGRDIGVSVICPGFARAGGDRPARRRRLRDYPPEKVADVVLRAVLRDAAVVPVTPEARAARALSRVAPASLRALARLRRAR